VATLYPQLRSDLEILTRRTPNGETVFLIKDPTNQRVFEFGEGEFFLCQQLDGRTDVPTIQARAQATLGHELTLENLEAFVRHLEREGLLDGDRASPRPVQGSEFSFVPRYNIRLGNPDRLLGWLAQRLRWCASRVFLAGTVVMVLLGVYTVILYGRTLFSFIDQLRNVSSWLFLGPVGLFCVNLPRVLVSGLACKYHGGPVPEMGIRFVFRVMPRFYVDLSRVRWFPRKAQRLWTFFSSGYAVIVLFAIGILGWRVTAVGSYPNTFFLALAACSTASAFLRWNPLMPLDAYRLLSTWLGTPRLLPRAAAIAKAWLLRLPLPEPLSQAERRGFRWYGLLAGVWLVGFLSFVLWILGDWLTTYYKGAGAVAFGGLVLLFLHRPIVTQIKKERPVEPQPVTGSQSKRSRRWILRLALLIVLAGVLLLPYPYTVGGSASLLSVQKLQIASEISGVIEKIYVVEGDRVKAGQPLVKLVQRDYLKELETSQAQLREAQANLDLLYAGAKPEDVALAEQKVVEAEVKVQYSEVFAKRQAELVQQEFISQQDYENALKQRDNDQEALRTARKQLETVKAFARPEQIKVQEAEVDRLKQVVKFNQEQLARTIILSPIDGVIITPHIEEKEGQFIDMMSGSKVGEVENSLTIRAEVLILEDDVSLVQVGQAVELRPWAYPDVPFYGKVVSIAPVSAQTVDPATKVVTETVRVITELPNENQLLKSGMTGYAKIRVGDWLAWQVLVRRLSDWLKVEFWSWWP
jgi:multidrug resistance efflux pump